ncbi:tRNA (N6-threonylcarbamoyladenosine(37)-N6)-methyltransferase TrmO [Stappia sp. WLB 29]|uniref:tRNA (N6-threonylcarbamoyladenosine(37)-N6)-methyltransferase TrmO n=1 Tax=Stappia sp. WLB 29 TaxID=2925220 RepID=UPI0020BF72C0
MSERSGEETVARPGEEAFDHDPARGPFEAGLVFIGHVETPWATRAQCPRNGRGTDAVCRVRLKPEYRKGLKSVDECSHLILLYWMHKARRDLAVLAPGFADETHGCFGLRAPVRPNPVSLSVVQLLEMTQDGFLVRGLDCLNGTPLIDIKPYFVTTDSVPEARVRWRDRLKDAEAVSPPGDA